MLLHLYMLSFVMVPVIICPQTMPWDQQERRDCFKPSCPSLISTPFNNSSFKHQIFAYQHFSWSPRLEVSLARRNIDLGKRCRRESMPIESIWHRHRRILLISLASVLWLIHGTLAFMGFRSCACEVNM